MTTPFDPGGELIIVLVRVTGPTGDALGRLALDTGAMATMIDTWILTTVGYDPAVALDRVHMTSASGTQVVPRLKMERVEALGRHRDQMAVVAHTLPPTASVDGLLGLDFFEGRRLTIDFAAGQIELCKESGYGPSSRI